MASHLEEYLSYYKDLAAPGYAVLVTGDWGVGKTFQVKKIFEDKDRYYVSLFGLQSAAEVHAAVLAEVDPTLSGAKKLFGGIEEKAAAGGHWITALGSLAAAAVGAALRKDVKLERTLIFDDLERSSLDAKDLLGVINSYIEQRDARVIVLAHDEKLAEQFVEMKEKLFGQTIRVEPLVSDAFAKFKLQMKTDEQRAFIERYREQITSVFAQSRQKSLRILRHVLEDIGRLHDALAPEHLENDRAMSELVSLFCSFDIEVRAGDIKPSDLRNRRGARIMHLMRESQAKRQGEKVEPPALVFAGEKYIGVDFESAMLTDDSLVEMLIEGRYRRETLLLAMAGSHYFIKPEEASPWKVVINFDGLSDEVVADAAEKMERQFDERQVTEPGEMLHIFALKLMMAEKGIRNETLDDIKLQCLKYVDELLSDKRLPPANPERPFNDNFSESYAGHGYWRSEGNAEHFDGVRQHLVKAREEALKKRFPEFALQLLEYLRSDGQKFLDQVCQVGNGQGQFARIPVLLQIHPEEFVAEWFSSPNENWRLISMALEARYGSGQLEQELAGERVWISNLVNSVEKAADETEGFRALRMRRAIHPLKALIEEELIT